MASIKLTMALPLESEICKKVSSFTRREEGEEGVKGDAGCEHDSSCFTLSRPSGEEQERGDRGVKDGGRGGVAG